MLLVSSWQNEFTAVNSPGKNPSDVHGWNADFFKQQQQQQWSK